MRKIILFIFAMVAINATTPTYENVTRLYVATFDRAPDVAGLKYWVNDSGLELEEIARSFFDQPETKAKYYPDGTIHLGSFVDEVYLNLFDRAPDSAGRAYWIDAMNTGKDHFSTFILAVINGAQGNDAVILADKTKYATPFTKTEIGVMSLSITDAKPRLPEEPIAVNITVTGIEFNYNGKWTDVNDFEFGNDTYEDNNFIRQTFNLLELQNGNSLHLGNIVLPAGEYKEIRFKLDAPEKGAKPKSNPGCNIVFEDAYGRVWSEPLFVPSGGQSGYKGKGEFEIMAYAKIEIMADFNVEQSIVVAGNSGKYILKPVIRLVVTELSGTINGTVVDIIETFDKNNDDLSVYAYEAGTYGSIYPEGDEIVLYDEEVFFPNAVSSTDVNMTDGNFTLPFLKAGAYDLVTVNYPLGTENTDPVVVDVEKGSNGNGVIVSKATETFVDINTSD